MSEWVNALLFGVALVAFVLGISSIIMAVLADKKTGSVIIQRIEYGFLGVSGLVFCLLVIYAML